MLTLSDAKKIPYSQVDTETEMYLYDMFRRYIVRKQIAENNKILKSVFARKLRTNNPRDFSNAYNNFNSAFIGCNLINQLSYDEWGTDFLKKMTEDRFNYHLNMPHNSFERKIALICYSSRASERIANRADFSVMVAYANMQSKVIEYVKKYPNKSLANIINLAAGEVRLAHERETGLQINQTQIAEKRTDYKSFAKKAIPLWHEMLQSFQRDLDASLDFDVYEFLINYFVFFDADKEALKAEYQEALKTAAVQVEKERNLLISQKIRFNSYYDVSDYDETFSPVYQERAVNEAMKLVAARIFKNYIDELNLVSTEKNKQ